MAGPGTAIVYLTRDIGNGIEILICKNSVWLQNDPGFDVEKQRVDVKGNVKTHADAVKELDSRIAGDKSIHYDPNREGSTSPKTERGRTYFSFRLLRPAAEFTFPKGSIAAIDGGDLQKTARREVKEELGLDLPEARFVPKFNGKITVAAPGGRDQEVNIALYHASLDANEANIPLTHYAADPQHSEIYSPQWTKVGSLMPSRMNIQSRAAMQEIKPTDLVHSPPAPAPAGPRKATSYEEAVAYLQRKIDEATAANNLKEKVRNTFSLKMLNADKSKYGDIIIGGRKTRRTGRSKLGTKKQRMRGRAGKTRRAP